MFPPRDVPAKLRTTNDILQSGIKAGETGKPVKGIKGISSLLAMDWFDIPFMVVPDHMHGLLLGEYRNYLRISISMRLGSI